MKIVMRVPKAEIELVKLKGKMVEVDMTNISALGESSLTFLKEFSTNNTLIYTNVESNHLYKQFDEFGIPYSNEVEQISLF